MFSLFIMFSASSKQDWLMPSEQGSSGSKWAIGSISDAYFGSSMGITECRNDTTLIHSYGCFVFQNTCLLCTNLLHSRNKSPPNTLRNFSQVQYGNQKSQVCTPFREGDHGTWIEPAVVHDVGSCEYASDFNYIPRTCDVTGLTLKGCLGREKKP